MRELAIVVALYHPTILLHIRRRRNICIHEGLVMVGNHGLDRFTLVLLRGTPGTWLLFFVAVAGVGSGDVASYEYDRVVQIIV